MPNNKTHSWSLAKRVLAKLKRDIITSNDIIPFVDFPFFIASKREQYIKKFGLDKIVAYEKHTELLRQIRALVAEYYRKYENTIVYPMCTLKMATAMCGVGECDEISQKAVIDLTNLGCKEEINLIFVTGKTRVDTPDPANPNHYYGHVFVIIGEIKAGHPADLLQFFQTLPDTHVLLDPKFKIVAAANKTSAALKDVFEHLEINKIFNVIGINPLEQAAASQKIACNAESISKRFAKYLKIKIPPKFPQDMFFSTPEKQYKDSEHKPTPLLVSEDELSWNTCMQRYNVR